MSDRDTPPRVFISFARDNPQHIDLVRRLYRFLRDHGIDARWDGVAGEKRQDWLLWMSQQSADARFIVVIASPKYKLGAMEAPDAQGYGVASEARLIRDIYENPREGLDRVVPVVLPGRSVDEFPNWLSPHASTYYEVTDWTIAGAEKLLRLLLDQPYETEPEIKARLRLPTRDEELAALPGSPSRPTDIAAEFGRALDTFEGRRQALREIVTWLRDPDNRNSRFVTGDPGSGKTALLGVIAHLGAGFGTRVSVVPDEERPPENSIDIALYIRNMLPENILRQLAQAAGLSAGEVEKVSSGSLQEGRIALVTHLRDRKQQLTVLLDALDEVSIPEDGSRSSASQDLQALCDDLVKPLVAETASPIRFLLGGRPQVLRLAGFRAPEDDERVLDLDGAYQDGDALRRFVASLLNQSPLWAEAAPEVGKRALDVIIEKAGHSFYVGELIAKAQALVHELPNPSLKHWQDGLPRQAGAALYQELRSRLADETPRALALLLPLAYGRGDGIPWTEVWLPLANALRPEGTEPYTHSDLQWIKEHTSSYVVEGPSGEPGRTLFRLHHRSLGDYLREDERYRDGEHSQAGDEQIISATLLGRVHTLGQGRRDWAAAPTYIRSHLLEHAFASGLQADIDRLVLDPVFLANASRWVPIPIRRRGGPPGRPGASNRRASGSAVTLAGYAP